VAVELESQSEVAYIIGTVAGLTQGFDDHSIDLTGQSHLLCLLLDGADQRGAVFIVFDKQSDGCQLGEQSFGTAQLWGFVDTEDTVTISFEAFGGGLVGQQHTLFDQGVGGGTGLDAGTFEKLLFCQAQPYLFTAEIKAVFEPFMAESLCDLLQRLEPAPEMFDDIGSL